jgi:hypothetical protein
MLGLAKMAPDSWRYYTAEIAEGREDYFAREEEGRWLGRGAEMLGLSGPVTPEAMSRLFGQGRHPDTGEALGHRFGGDTKCRPQKCPQSSSEGPSDPLSNQEPAVGAGRRGPVPVAGYAISFSPPKSVSVLWALGDKATAEVVRAAHDAAVDAAVVFLHEHAGFTRRGRGGAAQADSEGWVAAGFTHRTSRAGDPQLHSHILVANKVRAVTDGRWLALDGRELYEVQKAAGLVYKAGLRAELSARLGVAWGSIDDNGGGEIVGVPPELIGWFSKRRQQVPARGGSLIAEREARLGRSLTAGERAE